MSEEGDSFWVSLSERIIGVALIIISASLLYFTATSSSLSVYSWIFGFLGVVVLIVGLFLLIVKPRE